MWNLDVCVWIFARLWLICATLLYSSPVLVRFCAYSKTHCAFNPLIQLTSLLSGLKTQSRWLSFPGPLFPGMWEQVADFVSMEKAIIWVVLISMATNLWSVQIKAKDNQDQDGKGENECPIPTDLNDNFMTIHSDIVFFIHIKHILEMKYCLPNNCNFILHLAHSCCPIKHYWSASSNTCIKKKGRRVLIANHSLGWMIYA